MNKAELELVIKRLNSLYNWDKDRISVWLKTDNAYLNFAKPMDFMDKNLGYKVLEIIDNEDNFEVM